MLDEKLKPWLIEVNKLPSFATDSPLDERVKSALIHDTIHLLNLQENQTNLIKRVDLVGLDKEKRQ